MLNRPSRPEVLFALALLLVIAVGLTWLLRPTPQTTSRLLRVGHWQRIRLHRDRALPHRGLVGAGWPWRHAHAHGRDISGVRRGQD